jgi:hypothetical protein
MKKMQSLQNIFGIDGGFENGVKLGEQLRGGIFAGQVLVFRRRRGQQYGDGGFVTVLKTE